MLVVRYEGGGSGSSLSSSVATTTTSIFDEFSSLDDQDAPAAVLTAAKALRVEIWPAAAQVEPG
jgi:hypothetical protein